MDVIIQSVIALGAKYPALMSFFVVVGVLRSVFKPLFVFLNGVVVATPGDGDNKILASVQGSSAYKYLGVALDYLASVKIPGYDV